VRVSIIDYGAGNLPSVEHAFMSVGAETERATQGEQIEKAKALVLPGVGHFSALMRGLRENALASSLCAAIDSGVPFLGICLGLEAVFTSSEEAPGECGLGLIPGQVQALPKSVKSPHMGWNQLKRSRPSFLLRGIAENAYFYFAHSYAVPAAEAYPVAVCDHGFHFAAVIERGNLSAVQFHPEKSGQAGRTVLRNFLESVE
jgi:imidazole glycerol phosphate synthase glutamine amidotransferase subunit